MIQKNTREVSLRHPIRIVSLICTFALAQNLAAREFVGPDSMQSTRNLTIFNQQLAGLVKETIDQNHSLKAAAKRIDEADANARIKSSYSPPRFEIGAMDASVYSFPNPFIDQMQMDYSLEQMIMFPGKLSNMKKAELKKKDMFKYDKTTLERELIRRIKSTFYEIYLIDRQLEINSASQILISHMIDIARTQYEVGMGKQADILRAQTELSMLRKKIVAREQQRQSMVAMINALRNKPVETPIGTVPEIMPMPHDLSFEEIQTKALGNRSELKSMQANLEMKKTENSISKLEWFPDFMIKGTYSNVRPMPIGADPMSAEFGTTTSTKSPDRWSIMVGATIPEAPWSWGKASSSQQQTRLAVDAAQEDLAEMENMTKSQIYDAFTQVKSNIRQLHITTSTLLPQAQQALESALASYRTGGQEFTMLLDAERMLLMARDDYHMTVMNYLESLSKLERVTGSDLDLFFNGDK